jgi:hypothetical protein
VWRQDHPRRGLVVSFSAATEPSAVLDWMVRAGAALCSEPVIQSWRAVIHHRRQT